MSSAITVSALNKEFYLWKLKEYKRSLCSITRARLRALFSRAGAIFAARSAKIRILVISPALTPTIAGEEIFGFLRKRRGLLDAICISGGEPLLQPDIAEFIMRCREMGYLVKLDTNGSFPDLLQRLIDAKLLNYIAMDIKTAPERYSVLTGVRNIDIGPVLASVDIIRNSGVEHEFRTTVVNELHSPADFERIGQWLKGEERYFLQLFVDSGALIGTGLSPASEGKMREYLSIVQKYIPTAKLRGI